MFDIGWQEFLIVIVVMLIVVGPKDLPRIIRAFGQWTGKARSYARDFQRTIEEAAEETEMSAIRKEIELANKEIASVQKTNFDVGGSIKLDDDGPGDSGKSTTGTAATGAAANAEPSAPKTPDPATAAVAQAVQAGESGQSSSSAVGDSKGGAEASSARPG